MDWGREDIILLLAANANTNANANANDRGSRHVENVSPNGSL